MNYKKILPWALVALAGVLVFGFGQKIMQFFGVAKSEAEKVSDAQARATAKAVLEAPVDEDKLTHSLADYTLIAKDCFDLAEDWFHMPSFVDELLRKIALFNAADARQLAKAYIQYSPEKTLYQAIKAKYHDSVFASDENRVWVAFNDLLTRGHINI